MSRNLIVFRWLSLFLLTLQAPAADTKVVVHRLTLKALHNVSAVDQQNIIQEIKSHTYRGQLNEISGEIGERVRFAFQKRGYFKVEVAEPTITAEKKDGERELIDVSVGVTEGEGYRLKDIGFSSTDVLPADELRRAFPTADGDIFDREKIAFGLDNLRRLYCTKGYVNFSAVPDAQIDDKERRISLRIDLDEGPVFRVGRLTVRGEESQGSAREAPSHLEGIRRQDLRLHSAGEVSARSACSCERPTRPGL